MFLKSSGTPSLVQVLRFLKLGNLSYTFPKGIWSRYFASNSILYHAKIDEIHHICVHACRTKQYFKYICCNGDSDRGSLPAFERRAPSNHMPCTELRAEGDLLPTSASCVRRETKISNFNSCMRTLIFLVPWCSLKRI